MTKEIEDKVMMTTQDSANRLKQESGVEPSLTYREIKTYLDRVLEEVAKVKVKKSNVNVVLSRYFHAVYLIMLSRISAGLRRSLSFKR
jgi:hypothetical protein